VAVPAAAAVLLPRRLGRWLLGGWTAVSAGICLTTVVPGRDTVGLGTGYAIALGSALAALAVATASLSRWGKATAGDRTREGRRLALVTVAVMAVPPLLATGGAVSAFLAAHGPVPEVKALWAPAVSADGRLLYVPSIVHNSKEGHSDYEHDPARLVIVDTVTNRPAGPPVPVGSGASAAVASHHGARVYVANAGSSSLSVISTLGHATAGTPIAIRHVPRSLAVSADDSRLLVTGNDLEMSVIDTRSGSLTSHITLPADSKAVTLSPDGTRAYVCRGDQCDLVAIDTGTGRTVTGPVRLGRDPDSLAVSGDGSRLYAAASLPDDVLRAIDTRTLKTIGRQAPLGPGPHFNVAITPDSRRAYVGNLYGGSVSVIDLQEMQLAGPAVPVGDAAGGVAVSPDGRRVYVTLLLTSTVATFRTDSPGTVSQVSLDA
jgi:DNA-binding beta-propeller fold protein YncE